MVLSINNLSGFGGGVVQTSVEFLQATESTANLSVYTFSSQNLGAEDLRRKIVVCVALASSGSIGSATVTVGGVSATSAVSVSSTDMTDLVTAIFYAEVPTGTSGSIVVTPDVSSSSCGIFVYRVVSTTLTVNNTGTDTTSDPAATLSCLAGGAAFAVAASINAAATAAWTNATETGELNTERGFSSAMIYPTTSGNTTVTCAWSSGSNQNGVFSSFAIT